MTTIREFQCNFCKAKPVNQDIIGLRWVQKDLVPDYPLNTENHICKTCYDAICDSYRENLFEQYGYP